MDNILIGDIGGTKTILSLIQSDAKQSTCIKQATYSSHDFGQLDRLITAFLTENDVISLDVIVLALAGPVVEQSCQTTNLPWSVSAKQLKQQFSCRAVHLLNDIEAAALGLIQMGDHQLVQLNPNYRHRPGHRAVISVGTGLGEALLFWDGQQFIPSPAEGGHEDFAPSSEKDLALWQHLKKSYPEHISYERVVSGPGLELIYRFLCEYRGEPNSLPEADTSAWISSSAIEQSDPLAIQTMDIFIRLLAKEAANLSLKVMAIGGIYITGGVPPKIRALFESGDFVRHYIEKGRFKDLLSEIPIWLCLQDDAPLQGALAKAKELLGNINQSEIHETVNNTE